MGKNTVEAKKWLDKRYRNSTPGKSTIIDWYAEFKRDRTNTDDAKRSGRPKSAVIPENITKVHKIVSGDRKLKLHEIADTLQMSEGSVFTILHESLGMCKLFSKWVPRPLTPDQKQQRVEDSERCLELFMQGKKDFLHRYVTKHETCIHHYTPETKTQQWVGKVMASVFWDAYDILFVNYLEKGKTINSEYFMILLHRLSAEIKKNGLTCKRKKWCSTKHENDGQIE